MAERGDAKGRIEFVITVREWSKDFLADAGRRLKPNTLNWYRRSLTDFATDFDRRNLADLTPQEIENWVRKHTGWGLTTQAHVLSILDIAFRRAHRRGWIPRNPLASITKPTRRSRGETAVITAEEHSQLLASASSAFRKVLQVLHATGARPSEVSAITAENFDEDAGVVRLLDHKLAHRGKKRTLYLTPQVIELLKQERGKFVTGPLLRNQRGNRWKKDAIVLAMRRLRKRTGIKATAYFYRHTLATDALANGVPEAHVAELLGHSSTQILHRVYSHLGTKSKLMGDSLRRVR